MRSAYVNNLDYAILQAPRTKTAIPAKSFRYSHLNVPKLHLAINALRHVSADRSIPSLLAHVIIRQLLLLLLVDLKVSLLGISSRGLLLWKKINIY